MDIQRVFSIFATLFLGLTKFVKGNEEQNSQTEKSPFIAPEELSDIEDVFTRGDNEYVFINYPIDYLAASALCKESYKGRLAFVTTVDLAKFLAEALSETNLFMDVLWIGGQLTKDGWFWYEGRERSGRLTSEIINLFVNYSESVPSKERKCLGFARKNHDVPHFPALKCTVLRPFMCERDVSGRRNGSTHDGWIRIGPRLYKIFQERVSWMDATAKCIVYDRDSRLAVLANFPDSQALGRYLLIGRPSLENAWVGAKYYSDHYAFTQESIILANVSNAYGYPPWRNGTIRKVNGCILLDRHLSNTTIFVEARCDRLRPYVCYKWDVSSQDPFTDILIDEFGYRIYMNKLPWDDAKTKCDRYKEKYQAKLAEIRERRIVFHLIYVMGENKTAIQHIWLGGTFDFKIEQWCWDSDRSLVDLKILDWLSNTTYFERVEQFNTCLDMDRENHLKAIHYGTVCEYPQNYVCMFPREKLVQLERDELQNTPRRVMRRIEKRSRKSALL